MSKRIQVNGMWGLGDNIYQRPFIRNLIRDGWHVHLDTPWPELYTDLAPNIDFVRQPRALRTQMKNMERQPIDRYGLVPKRPGLPLLRNGYNLANGNVYTNMVDVFRKLAPIPPEGLFLDLPTYPQWDRGPAENRPIMLLRPVTERQEWLNVNRNPLPEYIFELSNIAYDMFHIVVIADIDPPHETLVGQMPVGHEFYVKGELSLSPLMSLVQAAAVLAGPVGWIVPAAIAAEKPAIVVHGGQGGHNAPEKLIAAHWSHRVHSILPANFCQCVQMRGHKCDKTIPEFSKSVTNLLRRLADANA